MTCCNTWQHNDNAGSKENAFTHFYIHSSLHTYILIDRDVVSLDYDLSID